MTGASPLAVLIASSLIDQSTAAARLVGQSTAPMVNLGSRRIVIFSATVIRSNRPMALRSSVTMAMPALIAISG